jgi:hypothetical protein
MNWIVTVCRMERNRNHDPKNKKTGPCEWSEYCTDVTGDHHSFVMYGLPEASVRNLIATKPGWRLTRLEKL